MWFNLNYIYNNKNDTEATWQHTTNLTDDRVGCQSDVWNLYSVILYCSLHSDLCRLLRSTACQTFSLHFILQRTDMCRSWTGFNAQKCETENGTRRRTCTRHSGLTYGNKLVIIIIVRLKMFMCSVPPSHEMEMLYLHETQPMRQ